MGSDLGHYRLLRLLGRGGFGEVYEAEDTLMKRRVALKVIAGPFAADPEFRERLFREARTAGSLQDPHVITIHGCGEIDGRLYLDMRLIDGVDLGALLKRSGPLPPRRAVVLISQIASALDAAHAQSMVHRDIKPANVIVTDDAFACLVDFGLANAAGDSKLTGTGMAIGTVAYMAPERFGSGETGPAADVYALACVLFECLTGTPPFAGDFPTVFGSHMSAPVPQVTPGSPNALDAVIARGMAKNPADRYPSAGAFARAAQQAVDQAGSSDVTVVEAPPVYSAAPPAYLADPVTYPTEPPVPMTPPDPTYRMPQGEFVLSRMPPPLSSAKRRGIVLGAIGAMVAVVAAIVFFVVAPGYGSVQGERLPFGAGANFYEVAVSGEGAVYVSDLDSISELAPGATVPRQVPTPNCVPKAMTVGPDAVLHVACRWSNEWTLRSFAPGSDSPTVTPCPDLGDASTEYGLGVDSAGFVYANPDGKRIVRFAMGSTDVTELPFDQLRTVEADNNTRATDLAVSADGTVWVAKLDGQILKLESGATAAVQVGVVRGATSIAVNDRNDLYVIHGGSAGDGLHRVDPATGEERHIDLAEKPWDVAVDDAGNVYTNAAGDGIMKYSPQALGAAP